MSYPLAVLGVVAAFLWPWLDELKGPGAFIVGDWIGGAQYEDMRFASCEMAAQRAPWTIYVGINRADKPFVSFLHKNLFFKEKEISGLLHIGPDDPGVPIVLKRLGKREYYVRAVIPQEAADRLIEARHYRLSSREIFADFETGSLRSAWTELKRCALTRGSR